MVIEEILVGIFLLALLGVWILGCVRTFERNWVLALLLFLFLTPIWLCWAFVEIFLPRPVKQPTQIQIQPIEVTLKKD